MSEVGCAHDTPMPGTQIVNENMSFCALIDTGAQISLVSEEAWKKLKDNNELVEVKNNKISGIGKQNVNVVGLTRLKVKLVNSELSVEFPFAVVKEGCIPYCFILGAIFLAINDITVSFSKNQLSMTIQRMEVITNFDNKPVKLYRMEVSGSLFVLDCAEEIKSTTEVDDEEVSLKFAISNDELCKMQKSNYALQRLRHNIKNNIHTSSWNLPALNQFKRQRNKLEIISDVIVRKNEDGSCAIVVAFPFLVEILSKVHIKLGHIGYHKLVSNVSKQFWHPAMTKVSRDVCVSCEYCQFYKVKNQHMKPPMVKISAVYPFHTVAVDLLQFNKSVSGYVAVLTMVDLYSKWLAAIPIRDKRAVTVSNAFNNSILPSIPQIPERVLSDNGPEFRAVEFERILEKLNIEHVFSTPYMPSSNGAVERANRTLINFIKGVHKENNQWDKYLPDAVIAYNNTSHSSINSTPSQCIMSKAHSRQSAIPLQKETYQNWREGHPNFMPFKLKQKVIKRIQVTGNQLKNKLAKIYDGPFMIVNIQPNRVTYEIIRIGDDDRIIKAHHTQLRPYYDRPYYLRKYQVDSNRSDRDDVANEKEYSNVSSSNDTSSEEQAIIDFSGVNKDTGISTTCISETHSDEPILSKKKRLATEVKSCITQQVPNLRQRKSTQLKWALPKKLKNKATEQSKSIDLKKFHCSEKVNYLYDGKPRNIQSTPIIKARNREESLINFQKYLDEINSSLSSLEQLEKSLKTQEEIIEEANLLVSQMDPIANDSSKEIETQETKESFHSQSIIKGEREVEKNNNASRNPISEQKSQFSGFMSNNSNYKDIKFRIQTLMHHAKETIVEGKERAKMVRDIWEYRQGTTIIASETDSHESELGDTLAQLPKQFSSDKCRLRSQGGVPNLPYVQPRILEYKPRLQ